MLVRKTERITKPSEPLLLNRFQIGEDRFGVKSEIVASLPAKPLWIATLRRQEEL
jgi:hypothetical protein